MLKEYYDQVGSGWKSILEDLAARIDALLKENGAEGKKIPILQVKEKFGGLRVYLNTCEDVCEGFLGAEIQTAVALAENLSYKTCEQCGAKDVETRSRKNQRLGWVRTLCTSCHEEQDKKGL